MSSDRNPGVEFVSKHFALVSKYNALEKELPRTEKELDSLEQKILTSARSYLAKHRLTIDDLSKKIVYINSQYWRMRLRPGAPRPFIEFEPVGIIYVGQLKKKEGMMKMIQEQVMEGQYG